MSNTTDRGAEDSGVQLDYVAGRPEMRFALALNGGVSLAVWIGGVANEILRLCRGSDPTYRCLTNLLNLQVRADVLNGASAGGINAVFLALGLLYGHDDLASLRDLWVQLGDFDKLLRDPLDSEAPSLMRGDDFFLPALRRAIEDLMGVGRDPSNAMDMDVQLTVTSLTGELEFRSDDVGGVLPELRHDALITFQNERGDFDHTEGNVVRLARACRSTASFPAAFEPSFVRVRDDELSVADSASDDGAFRSSRDIGGVTEDRYLVDGGVLVNLPIEPTIEAVFSKYARGEVRRILAMVVPDPSTLERLPPNALDSPPGLLSVVGASASGLPRTQLVGRFIDDLRSHNHAVRILKDQRLALLAQIGSIDGLEALAKSLFDAYLAGRLAANRSQAEEDLSSLIRENQTLAKQFAGWREAIDRAFNDSTFAPPWIPTPPGDHFSSSEGWGASIVERSYGRLLHILNTLTTDYVSVDKIKTELFVIWERVGVIDAKDEARILGGVLPPGSVEDHVTFIVDRARGWPGTADDRAAIAQALEDLASQAEGIGDLARGQSELDKEAQSFLAALPTAGEGLRFLLALEVIECAFGDFDQLLEQVVAIAQIDSLTPAPIDKRGRKAHEKVAGVQLGHFGGFLKRSWRANDWMWGRLDAATHLCRILIMHEGSAKHLPALAEAVGLPQDASVEGIAWEWAHAVQRGILVEELPEVAEAVRADSAAGSLAGTPSSDFLAAYDRKTGPKRDELTSDTAIGLLEMQRIGQERLSDELGSDLVTRTSMHAFATASTVIQRGSPAVLRTGVAAIRYVALLAWAMTRTAASRSRLLNTFGALLFGAGLVGVVLDLFTGVELGIFALPAWVAFGAGVLLAFARAPVVVVPTLALALIPRLFLALPPKRWFWVPHEWPWPTGDRGAWEWISIAGFVAAGLVIGLVRRPRWLTGYHRRVRERLAALDATLQVSA